jgi:hypothetical protein
LASEQDLQQVKRIVLGALKGYPARVFLFGSHATGRATTTSDIDVAVVPTDELPSGLLSRIREALEESTVPYRVDLVDLSKTDSAFCRRVLQEGIEWID